MQRKCSNVLSSNVLFISVFYFDSLASYCVCVFYLLFLYSALVANKGLIIDFYLVKQLEAAP